MKKETIEDLRVKNTQLAEALDEAISAIEKVAGDEVLWNKKVQKGRTLNTLVEYLHKVLRESE